MDIEISNLKLIPLGFKLFIVFEQIHDNISRYVSFSDHELSLFDAALECLSVPKKTIMLREGEVCNFEAFVVKGCLRKYYIDANGHEVILQFAVEDSWISDISFSIYEALPSQVYIETIEDCELLTFSPESKEILFTKAPRFERAFRILVQRNLAVVQNRLFCTILRSGIEKYQDFLLKYPTIPQRVPQHYIASYLGISAEFLSKVRAKIAQQ